MTTVGPTVTRPFAHAFAAYGRQNNRVVSVTNDLTRSSEADLFRSELPDRSYSLGMAEQNLVGVLSGLAREGLEPIYTSFAVFTTRRPYEQIALNVAYPNLPVRLMGFLPGITTPGGVTHQATDDLALMRNLPNMTVLELADATDVETFWGTVEALPGPLYCRVPRGEVARLFTEPFELDRVRSVSAGDDLTVLSMGAAVPHASKAIELMRSSGLSVAHLVVSTLKPFDDEEVPRCISRSGRVITVENHLVSGGLGTAVAEVIAESGLNATLRRIGIADTFTHGGTPGYLFGYYGIDTAAIIRAARVLLGDPLEELDLESLGPSLPSPTSGTSWSEAL